MEMATNKGTCSSDFGDQGNSEIRDQGVRKDGDVLEREKTEVRTTSMELGVWESLNAWSK